MRCAGRLLVGDGEGDNMISWIDDGWDSLPSCVSSALQCRESLHRPCLAPAKTSSRRGQTSPWGQGGQGGRGGWGSGGLGLLGIRVLVTVIYRDIFERCGFRLDIVIIYNLLRDFGRRGLLFLKDLVAPRWHPHMNYSRLRPASWVEDEFLHLCLHVSKTIGVDSSLLVLEVTPPLPPLSGNSHL